MIPSPRFAPDFQKNKARAVGGNQHPVMKGELEGAVPLMRIGPRRE